MAIENRSVFLRSSAKPTANQTVEESEIVCGLTELSLMDKCSAEQAREPGGD